MSAAATLVCPECGARAVEGLSCWEQLGALIAWEYDDPELRAEHFLTVASYRGESLSPTFYTPEHRAGAAERVRRWAAAIRSEL